MSTEASGLPERRFLLNDGYSGPFTETMAKVKAGSDGVIWEAFPKAEADLLRKLVAAHKRFRDLDAEWKVRGGPDADGLIAAIAKAKVALCEALDALLAVAPHWGGE